MSSFNLILQRAFIDEDPAARFRMLKDELAARLESVRAIHDEGAPGRKVLKLVTKLVDELLVSLYSDAVWRHMDSNRPTRTPGLALVAVGGYGRAELNPHSDIDILILFDPKAEKTAAAVANEVLYPLWDLRLTVGHSVRTVADCVEIGQADLSAQTCMMESRLLAGDKELYDRFRREFAAKVVNKDVPAFLFQKAEEARGRHTRFGATVFLQQPNIKESPGGLRDIHYLIWIAYARYGTGDLKQLVDDGTLAEDDYRALTRAQALLWRIRNELHFAHGKRIDTLTFDEQLRIAEKFGYQDTGRQRGVERFMRRYYTLASQILDICSRFVDRATSRPLSQAITTMLFSRKVAPYFTLTNREIRVDPGKEEAFLEDGPGILNLFHLAQIHGLRIHPDTMESLSHARLPGKSLRSRAAADVFLKILQWDSGMAETLKRLHRLRILGRIIPEFGRVDRLVTFSQYHKYTVDAHTLYALELTENLRAESGVFADAYHEVRRKDLLHLAVLLHDAGKGRHRDHCEEGAELAAIVAQRMGLSERERDLLVFLVRQHLLMTHVGFRRDLSDPAVIARFVRDIETPERLKMLLVLTHVDIRAVGPDTWNSWKEGLLTELFGMALEILAGRPLVKNKAATIARVRGLLAEKLGPEAVPWLDATLDRLPGRYLLGNRIDEIVHHLTLIRQLQNHTAQVEIVPGDEGHAEIVVCAYDNKVPGLFSRIAGTLTAKDLEVHDARITTFRDDVILDVFRVRDPTATGFVDHQRWARIRTALIEVIEGRVQVESLFAGGHGRVDNEGVPFTNTEPLVRIDNETSDSFTVIDVFAADRQGLLYILTRTLAEQGLSIFFSRIGTKADQVVDVFYVKDSNGGKIVEERDIRRIRAALLEVATHHENLEPTPQR
ncbi:MAG: [protein-PII] uridylyltransferase [Nitrospirota bacterium]|nr:[protein-PII] uridylyltransferase [Nitrospirota bacterium]